MRRLRLDRRQLIILAVVVAAAGYGIWSHVASQAHAFSSYCFQRQGDVAIGPHDTVFVIDRIRKSDQILKFSPDGALLAHIGTTDSGMATDMKGALYYVRNGVLWEVTPDGVIHRRWRVGAVNRIAADGLGHVFTGTDTPDSHHQIVVTYSTTGHRLARWRTPYVGETVADGQGYLWVQNAITTDAPNGVAKLSPATGRVLAAFSASSTPSIDGPTALGRDPHGTIYVADTISGSTPFRLARFARDGASAYRLEELDRGQEQATTIAVDSHGVMFVGRASYARTDNYGIDQLSADGHVMATLTACHPN